MDWALKKGAFSVVAPQTWNSLPADIRSCHTLQTFKRNLKPTCSHSLNLRHQRLCIPIGPHGATQMLYYYYYYYYMELKSTVSGRKFHTFTIRSLKKMHLNLRGSYVFTAWWRSDDGNDDDIIFAWQRTAGHPNPVCPVYSQIILPPSSRSSTSSPITIESVVADIGQRSAVKITAPGDVY